ncbi:MAG: glycosyltransferase family 2 protein [Candidatus Calescibacterium sp.]
MTVSGFTIIRNGVRFNYYFVQSILSIIPICDEFIINYGESEDDTLDKLYELKKQYPEKIKIIRTWWDDSIREGGKILSIQTNVALAECSGDWCFYLQADEVVHEKYLDLIRENMKKYLNKKEVEGFAFNYLHFYASFWTYFDRRPFYRREVRIIRNKIGVKSYGDAQGFRVWDEKKNKWRKPKVKLLDAYIYHYGWVRPEKIMIEKQKNLDKFWHDDRWIEINYREKDKIFENFEGLKFFRADHPKVMKNIVEEATWQKIPSEQDVKIKSILKRILLFLEEKAFKTQFFEHKNYEII